MPRLDWLIRSTRTRTILSFQSRCRRTAKFWRAASFTSIGGQPRNRIARLDATTGLADSFDPNANNFVIAIAVQADGKILVGGNFTTLAPEREAPATRNHIARLEADGRLDQTLNPIIASQFTPYVLATAVQPDGKILIGGSFTTVLAWRATTLHD